MPVQFSIFDITRATRIIERARAASGARVEIGRGFDIRETRPEGRPMPIFVIERNGREFAACTASIATAEVRDIFAGAASDPF
jgi:hypothetical protein